VRTYHEGFQSTLQIGTFYLAGIRNFLFGSDTNAGPFTLNSRLDVREQ